MHYAFTPTYFVVKLRGGGGGGGGGATRVQINTYTPCSCGSGSANNTDKLIEIVVEVTVVGT